MMNLSLLISLGYLVDIDMKLQGLFYTENKAILVIRPVMCVVLVTILAMSHPVRTNVGPSAN